MPTQASLTPMNRSNLVVNAITRQVEEYQNPGPSGYQTKQIYGVDASFDLLAFPETTVYVRELFE